MIKKMPKNKAEMAFVEYALSRGWDLMTRGYPDYACLTETGELVLVEVKRKRGYRLKTTQLFLMRKLAEHGIRCYRWTPDGGFEQVVAPRKDL